MKKVFILLMTLLFILVGCNKVINTSNSITIINNDNKIDTSSCIYNTTDCNFNNMTNFSFINDALFTSDILAERSYAADFSCDFFYLINACDDNFNLININENNFSYYYNSLNDSIDTESLNYLYGKDYYTQDSTNYNFSENRILYISNQKLPQVNYKCKYTSYINSDTSPKQKWYNEFYTHLIEKYNIFLEQPIVIKESWEFLKNNRPYIEIVNAHNIEENNPNLPLEVNNDHLNYYAYDITMIFIYNDDGNLENTILYKSLVDAIPTQALTYIEGSTIGPYFITNIINNSYSYTPVFDRLTTYCFWNSFLLLDIDNDGVEELLVSPYYSGKSGYTNEIIGYKIKDDLEYIASYPLIFFKDIAF